MKLTDKKFTVKTEVKNVSDKTKNTSSLYYTTVFQKQKAVRLFRITAFLFSELYSPNTRQKNYITVFQK